MIMDMIMMMKTHRCQYEEDAKNPSFKCIAKPAAEASNHDDDDDDYDDDDDDCVNCCDYPGRDHQFPNVQNPSWTDGMGLDIPSWGKTKHAMAKICGDMMGGYLVVAIGYAPTAT